MTTHRLVADEISSDLMSYKHGNMVEAIFAAQDQKESGWAIRYMWDTDGMTLIQHTSSQGHKGWTAIGPDWEQCANWVGKVVKENNGV